MKILLTPFLLFVSLIGNESDPLDQLAYVEELGVVKIGDGLEERISDRQIELIVSNSPLQPAITEGLDNLFSKEQLDEYLSFLNRHPNRKVDARIYSLAQDTHVGIEFLITEDKSWRTYIDTNNYGNQVTGLWQQTWGIIDTQLTGVDDIFKFEATTDTFHSFYTVSSSYDRPILAWPWARWKLGASVNRFAAADLGFEDKSFIGTQATADLIFRQTAAQRKDLFFDVIEGLRYYNIQVTNKTDNLPKNGKIQFAAPSVGLSFDQIQSPQWRFSFKTEALFCPPGISSNRNEIDNLGRMNTSDGWSILSAQLNTGFYVGGPRLANEFSFQAQGQYAFNYRLIPQLKYVVGGFNTVRGYTEAINSGDSAIVGRAEYLLHIPSLFSSNPHRKSTLFGKEFRAVPAYLGDQADWDWIVRLFFDSAYSYDSEIEPTTEQNSALLSTGLGMELALWQNFMIRADWGITLNDALNQDMGHSIFYLNSTIAY